MAAQVHPEKQAFTGTVPSKDGPEDEEAPSAPQQSTSMLSGLTAEQIELKTSKKRQKIAVAVMFAFIFIDCIGGVLFAPAMGALCQLAKGGPYATMANLLLLPSGALETEDMAGIVPPELVVLHEELEHLGGEHLPPRQSLCTLPAPGSRHVYEQYQ